MKKPADNNPKKLVERCHLVDECYEQATGHCSGYWDMEEDCPLC